MTVWQWIGDAIWTSLPVLGVGVIVWLLFRSIVRADRNERDAYAKIEAEMRAELAAKDENKPTKPGK
jgi:flagellar biosynthesis/type III secretory pathway M-ring protein FliF/YscJ